MSLLSQPSALSVLQLADTHHHMMSLGKADCKRMKKEKDIQGHSFKRERRNSAFL